MGFSFFTVGNVEKNVEKNKFDLKSRWSIEKFRVRLAHAVVKKKLWALSKLPWSSRVEDFSHAIQCAKIFDNLLICYR